MGGHLKIILSLYPDGLEPQNGNLKYDQREFLTKLYAVVRDNGTGFDVEDGRSLTPTLR